MWEMIVWTSGWLQGGGRSYQMVTGAAAAGDYPASCMSVKGQVERESCLWKNEIKAPRNIVSIMESPMYYL